jgi:hypothetical protein
MTSASRAAIAALALFITVAEASAAAEFTAVSRSEGSGGQSLARANTTVRGRVDGDKGRLDYIEGGLGSLPKGSIVVTTDGGRSAKLYRTTNDKESCGDLPLPGMPATGMRAQAVALTRFENIRVDKTLDENGGKLHQTATRHLRYAVAYDSRSADPAAKPVHTTLDLDVWVAPSLSDAAYVLALASAPHTGNPDADHQIAAAMPEAVGAALKRVQRTTLGAVGGETRKLTTTMEVTKLSLRKPSAKSLAPPFDCRIGPSPE